MAILPAKSGPVPPPTGAGGGPGAPGRVPVPPLRHVRGGPRCPHDSQPRRLAEPRGLPPPGPAASAAPQLSPYPRDDFVGPLPGDIVRHQPRLRPGTPPGWRWPKDFIRDLLRWAQALAWMLGPTEVSWAELALDYEAFVVRALPGPPAAGYVPAARGTSPNLAQGSGLAECTLRQARCSAGPCWGAAAHSSPWGAACVRDFRPARSSPHATR